MVNKLRTKEKLVGDKNEEAAKNPLILVSSSDEEEANMDLSHQIVEKARLKQREKDSVGGGGDGVRSNEEVIDVYSSSCEEVEGFVGRSRRGGSSGGVVMEQRKKKKKRKPRRKNKKKSKIIENEEENKAVGVMDSEEPTGTLTSVERESVVEMEQPNEDVEVIEAEKLVDKVKAEEPEPVGVVKMEQLDDTGKITETDGLVDVVEVAETAKDEEIDAIETDNIVLRKLLRGPRYFDPPDRNSRTCYYCDGEGHNAANCTSKKRKKPCFICGSSEHGVRNCSQGQDCFNCKKPGHRAKDCPEKHQTNSIDNKICLRCGDVGHLMSSCSRDYDPEDLKEIQCYICKTLGHLCCVEPIAPCPGEVSCYKCGQLGHIGVGCEKQRGNVNGAAQATSCYRCGEKGHLVRACKGKPRRLNQESSTPTRKDSGKGKELLGVQSAPPGPSKVHTNKQTQNEERDSATKQRSKWKWVNTDVTQNHLNTESKENGWKSHVTPVQNIPKIPVQNTGSNPSNSQSPDPSKFHANKQTQYEERDFVTEERLKRKWCKIDTTQNHLNKKSKDNVWMSPVTPKAVQNTRSLPSNSQSSLTPSHLNPRTPNPRGSSYHVRPATPTYASPNVNHITPISYGSFYSGYPADSLHSAYRPNPTSHVYSGYPLDSLRSAYRPNMDPRYSSPIGSGGWRNYW